MRGRPAAYPLCLGKPAVSSLAALAGGTPSRAEGTSLTTLDLMLVTPVLFEVWNDRELVRTFDTDIKVVSKTALIKMKQLAGRLQDLADIESLRSISEPEGA